MEKNVKCVIGEQIGEVLIGGSTAIVLKKMVFPKCDTNGEKLIVTLGTCAASFVMGRVWAKHWYKFCDANFDTDFEEIYESL